MITYTADPESKEWTRQRVNRVFKDEEQKKLSQNPRSDLQHVLLPLHLSTARRETVRKDSLWAAKLTIWA